MRIRSKLVLALVAIAAAMVVPLGIALKSLQRLHVQAAQLRDGEFTASLLLGRMRSGIDELKKQETNLILLYDSTSRAKMDSATARFAAMADSLESYQLDSAGTRIRAAVAVLSATVPAEFAAAARRDTAAADSLSVRHAQPAIAQAEFWVNASERALRERTRDRVATAASETEEAQRVAGIALAMVLLFALAVAVWITRSITRPIRELDTGMRAVADGDFGHRLPVSPERTDEFGHLASSYRVMAAQLAELDKLKAEFVSVASHELKTPINVILGYIQLLGEGVYGTVNAQQQDVLRTLESQCHSLGRLVKQLLDVSRFQAGGGKLEPRPLSLPDLLDDLEASFHVLARQRDIAFRVVRGGGLPDEVLWDLDRVNEVLGNLLSNAFKFTSPGGRVELSVDCEGELVQMDVRDTGAGIPPEQLPHIFRKFYQADNQAAADTKGTGLGLAIAKEIVEAHGGTIGVESTLGEGTTFSIALPVRTVVGRRSTQPRVVAATAS